MSSLVVGGTVIPVAVSSPSWGRMDAVDRGRTFDNTLFVSQAGGAAREWDFETPPVTTALADSYIAVLGSPAAKLCSGDILQLPTMCSPELPSGTPVRKSVGHNVVLRFRLHEVQPAKVLLRYAPGDTITGESFTRASIAHQRDAAGIYQSTAIDVKRDSHYIGGVRTFLRELERKNWALWSRDLSNAVYTMTGTGTASNNAVGLDGTANSATTIADTDAAVQTFLNQGSIVVANDNATHCFWAAFKKDTDQTRFPIFRASLSVGTLVDRHVHLNTQTGEIATVGIAGTGTSRVVDAGLWWLVEITLTNNTTGNTNARIRAYPAGATVLGVDSAAAQGSCVVGQVQVELNSAVMSSPIFTTTAAVTRSADLHSLPYTAPPGEMTVYVKLVESGNTKIANARLVLISSAGDVAPRFLLYALSTGVYRTRHSPSASFVESTLAAAPALGDTVELVSRLFGDGSVDTTQSLNGAAATSSVQSAALAPAAAWSGQLVWLNGEGSNKGLAAIQSFKIVAGVRSLEEMRAL